MTPAIDAISATGPATVEAATPITQPPDAGAIAQFERVLAQPAQNTAAVAPAARGAGTPPVLSTNAPSALGDRMLAGLQRVSESYAQQRATLSAITNYPGATVSNVLQLQLDVMHFSLQTEMLGKISGKAPQQLDQLLRMQ